MSRTPEDNGKHGASRPTKSLSLRAFLSRLIWVCMLPLLLLTVYLAVDRVQSLRIQCNESANNFANLAANSVDSYLNNQTRSLKALAASPLFDDLSRLGEAYKQAQGFRENFGTHVLLADPSGQMVLNTRSPLGTVLPKLPIPEGFAAAPHVVKTAEAAIGDEFFGPVGKEEMIAIVVPVVRDQSVKYTLLATIESSQFQKLLDKMIFPKQWSLKLVDGVGKVIAQRIPEGFQPDTSDDLGGRFVAPSVMSHWSIILDIPKCAYSSPMLTSAIAMILALMSAVLAGILGGRLAGRGLSRSVAALSEKPLPGSSRPLITDIENVRARLTEAIVDRNNAEDLRNQIEQRFRQLFEFAPIPLSYVELDGTRCEVNERFVKQFGYSREEVSDLEVWRSLAYPDQKYREEVVIGWKRAIAEALAKETDIPASEYKITNKNGENRTVLVSGVIIGTGVLTCFFDITERKIAEKSLRDSEERFRTLAEGTFEGVAITKDSKLMDFNTVFSRLTGFTVDELMGGDFLELVPPEYRGMTYELINSDNEQAYESSICRKDGSCIPVQMRSKPIPYGGGVARLVSVRDIEAMKKAEVVQKRLATAIMQAAEAVLITDSEGIIQYVNPALERISGFTANEVVGKTPRIFKSGEHDASFYKDLWKTLKSGITWVGRFTNRRKDGTLYIEEATISPVKEASGKIVNFVAVKRDVTEYLSLTRQLFQSQKLEAMGTLAGGIAHDFNNILQVCLGYSQLLAEDKTLPAQFKDDARNIYEASKRGADLVHRLLTFSKKREYKPQTLNLNQRINEIQKMLIRTIPKNIKIQLILDQDLGSINADPTQVDQVIMNVVVNARDAMPEGGSLTIETANVFLGEEYAKTHLDVIPGSYVVLMLTDTGIGMDEATMSRIFEPFFTTKDLDKGTGLGLSVVFGIVEQHGGFVRYYSQRGQGTTCKIYFPAIISGHNISPSKLKEIAVGGSETILIVDDEDQILDFLSRVLEHSGYSVITARNGHEALSRFLKYRNKLSLIILDLVMPEMDGKQCLEEVLKIDPSVKVMISSGFSANGKISNVMKSGAKAFVTKPYDIDQLLLKIREVIDAKIQ